MRTLSRWLVIVATALVVGACAGGPQSKSAGEVVDDTVIATKVKTALARDDRVSALDVEIEVFKGVVQLSGFVDSEEEAEIAEVIAADVRGVIDVKNRIDVRGR